MTLQMFIPSSDMQCIAQTAEEMPETDHQGCLTTGACQLSYIATLHRYKHR